MSPHHLGKSRSQVLDQLHDQFRSNIHFQLNISFGRYDKVCPKNKYLQIQVVFTGSNDIAVVVIIVVI